MFPNLIIAGAQKSGTTSLYKYLSQHAQVAVSEPKEPTFFSRQDNLKNLDKYKNLFNHYDSIEKRKVFLEASTSYLNESYVPERIYKLFGTDIKFIFVLRDPVERLFSAYWHLYKRFDELRSYEEVFSFCLSSSVETVVRHEKEAVIKALKQGKIRINRYKTRYDNPLWQFYYVNNSLYFKNIKRFLEFFPPENILVLIIESLQDEPEEFFDKIYLFLNIKKEIIDISKQYNQTVIPVKTNFFYSTLHFLAYSKLGQNIREKYKNIDRIYKLKLWQTKPDLDKEFKKRLTPLFVHELKELSNLSGVKLENYWFKF